MSLHLDRRSLLRLFGGIVASCGCGCGRQAHAETEWKSPWGSDLPTDRRPPWEASPRGQYAPQGFQDGGGWPSDLPAIGCLISAGAAGRIGPHGVLESCGNAVVDSLMYEEADVLASLMKVSPRFGFYDDGKGSNAFSTPEEIIPGSRFGTVVFGIYLLTMMLKYGGQTAVIGIMAHEWGHSVQSTRRDSPQPGRGRELQADYLAGWYLASKQNMFIKPKELAEALYSMGDFAFNTPDHHGTPVERVQAMTQGFQAGKAGYSLNEAFEHSKFGPG